MTTTDLHDPELEARLRALFAARAATIEGPPPGLHDIPVAGTSVGASAGAPHRRWRSPIRWAAVAAVVALMGVAAVRAFQPGTGTVRTGAEPGAASSTAPGTSTTTTVAPAKGRTNPAAAELPGWLDLTTTSPVFTADGDAAAVARAYLADRLGDGVAEVEHQLAAAVVLTEAATPIEGITALRFDQDAGGVEELPKGTVFLRQDEDRWGVVAAVTDGLSLASLVRDATGLTGTATGDPANQNLRSIKVVVADGDGKALAEAIGDAGTDPGAGSVAAFTARTRDESVRVRVTAAGGRTLGVTELTSDPTIASKALWSGSPDDATQRQDPESTARAWAASLTTPLPVASAEEADPTDGRAGAAVRLVLDGGLGVTVQVAEAPDGWVVLDAQDDADLVTASSAQLSGANGQPPVRGLRLAIPDTVTAADLTTWGPDGPVTETIEGDELDAGPDAVHVEEPGTHYAAIAFDPPRTISFSLLVGRNAGGAVVTVQTGSWA
ncbi:MAG: hypothetical protein ACTHN0_09180 [Aquihabitans sp.]